jgi:hypothetical protein
MLFNEIRKVCYGLSKTVMLNLEKIHHFFNHYIMGKLRISAMNVLPPKIVIDRPPPQRLNSRKNYVPPSIVLLLAAHHATKGAKFVAYRETSPSKGGQFGPS